MKRTPSAASSRLAAVRSTASSRSMRSKKDETAVGDVWCMAVRTELIQLFGSAKDAFSGLDLNRNGLISLQEFSDGLERLPADWQDLGGLARPIARELFKLLDERKAGSLRFVDLFPEEAATGNKEKEVTTPRFWSAWCSQPLPGEAAQDADGRKGPRWRPTPQEEHDHMVRGAEEIQQAEERRKWIMSTTERLKRKGKSDSRCREIVARHLPRGTGPKDRHDVQAFSDNEVRMCQKQYNDEVHNRSRRIQQGISDMRDQRRVLHDYKHKLWEVTVEPTLRQRQVEDELRNVATSLVGEAPGLLDKVKSTPMQMQRRRTTVAASTTAREESEMLSPRHFAMDVGLERLEANNIHVLFNVFAATSKGIRRKEFGKLMSALVGGRCVYDSNVSEWWQQVLDTATQGDEVSVSPFLSRYHAAEEDARRNPKVDRELDDPKVAQAFGQRQRSKWCTQKEATATFERFVTWWARCDLRPSSGAARARAATADLPSPAEGAAAAARPRASTEADALQADLDAQRSVAAQDSWNILVNG